MTLPTPEEGLRILGDKMRAVRIARNLTLQRAARGADVSRGQLARLEEGNNVSVLFLLKLANYYQLDSLSFDSSSQSANLDLVDVLRTLDLIERLVAHVRSLTVESALPVSKRRGLEDTRAVREFVNRHSTDPEGLARLTDAIARLERESVPATPPRQTQRTEGAKGTDRRRRRNG